MKVEAFLSSFQACPPPLVDDESDPLRQYLQKPADSYDLLNASKDLQAEASLYVDARPGNRLEEAEATEEEDADYLNEDAIVQRAVDEVALEGEGDEEADQIPAKSLEHESAPQASKSDDEDDLEKRLAGLSSPPPLPDYPTEEDEDPRTLSVLQRLQGLSVLQSAPTTKSNLPDNKIPSKFSAPGLSAERDDDIESWCSESGIVPSSSLRCKLIGMIFVAVCNQDATVTCFGCDEEVYCTSCWKETHQDDVVPKHRVKPFVFKRGSRSG